MQTAEIVAVLAVGLLLACGGAAHGARPPATRANQVESVLGPGDVFEVSVYGEREMSGKYTVADDGSINFPLAGKVAVAGLRAPEVAARIRTSLVEGQFLRDPTVSVTVIEQVSRRVTVLGAVARPGGYPLVPGMTALQAISAAGGLTPLAGGDSVVLTRKLDGTLRRFEVPVTSISEGETEDIPLQPGDILFVPNRVF